MLQISDVALLGKSAALGRYMVRKIYKFLSKLKTYLDSEELSNNGIKPSEDFVKTQLVP